MKCDERGRNADSVAYGGPLSTAAGCKRCEDSGRPCHGYGAQAPNRPQPHPYLTACSAAEMGNGSSKSFYQYTPSHQDRHLAPPQFSTHYPPPTDPSPPMLSDIASWVGSSDVHNMNEHYSGGMELHSQHLRATSSAASENPILATQSPTLHSQPTSLATPTLDLRRYSVPSYPTWHTTTPYHHHSSVSPHAGDIMNSFHIQRASGEVGNLDLTGLYQPEGTILESVSNGNHHLNMLDSHHPSFVAPKGSFHKLRPHDSQIRPVTQSAFRSNLASLDFGRPHTSTGVSLPCHQAPSKNRRSPLFSPPDFIPTIPEPPPYNLCLSPTTVNLSEVGKSGWTDTINGVNSLQASAPCFNSVGSSLSGYNSPSISQSISPATIQRTGASPHPGSFKPLAPTEASTYSPHDVHYDYYSNPLPPDVDSTFTKKSDAPFNASSYNAPSPQSNMSLTNCRGITTSQIPNTDCIRRPSRSGAELTATSVLNDPQNYPSNTFKKCDTLSNSKDSSSSSTSSYHSGNENCPSPHMPLSRHQPSGCFLFGFPYTLSHLVDRRAL